MRQKGITTEAWTEAMRLRIGAIFALKALASPWPKLY